MSDRLLYTLSTRGAIRLELFYELLDAAVISGPGYEMEPVGDMRSQTIRLLDSLGYCEFDYDQRQVWACPPSMARLPTCGLSEAVLVGGRTPALLQALKQEVRSRSKDALMQVLPQRFGPIQLPSAVIISSVSSTVLQDIATGSRIGWFGDAPAAWRLAAFSADIDDFFASCTFTSRASLNWPPRQFSANRLMFVKGEDTASELRFVAYKNPADQQLRHWLWQGSKAAEIERDWGRYLVLWRAGRQILFYDSRRQKLGVPSRVALPSLLARAAAMCSGRTPVLFSMGENSRAIPGTTPFLVYAGVPPDLANLIGQKVGQEPVPAICSEDDSRINPC